MVFVSRGGRFFNNNDLFEKQGAPVRGVAAQGRCFLNKNDLHSFWTSHSELISLNYCARRQKYTLSDLIPAIRSIGGIGGNRGNATNRAGPDLCSTRLGQR